MGTPLFQTKVQGLPLLQIHVVAKRFQSYPTIHSFLKRLPDKTGCNRAWLVRKFQCYTHRKLFLFSINKHKYNIFYIYISIMRKRRVLSLGFKIFESAKLCFQWNVLLQKVHVIFPYHRWESFFYHHQCTYILFQEYHFRILWMGSYDEAAGFSHTDPVIWSGK